MRWGANYKEVLEVRHSALNRIEGNTRAATDKLAICVKVTRVQPYTSYTTGNVTYKYKVCTRDAFLRKLQHRTTLKYQERLTAEVMGINEKKKGFITDLSVAQASE